MASSRQKRARATAQGLARPEEEHIYPVRVYYANDLRFTALEDIKEGLQKSISSFRTARSAEPESILFNTLLDPRIRGGDGLGT